MLQFNGNVSRAAIGRQISSESCCFLREQARRLTILLLCFFAGLFVAKPAAFAAERKKIVVPFDFVSKFDNGNYGQRIGDLLWKKLSRQSGFIIPETMLDVRDTVAANNVKLAADSPLDEVKRAVQGEFDADIAIWGSVERVPGHEWDVYDLKIRCVDFSVDGDPVVIYSRDVRTKTVSEIPHVYIKAMLDKLYGRKPGSAPLPDPIAEKNWREGKNLVEGGDFESGTDGVPYGWASRGGQNREPLGRLVQWLPETNNPENRVIRFTFDAVVGDGFGVMYYSDPFPVEEDGLYRFQCRYRSNGPKAKVFIKCYEETGRECYRSQNDLKGPNKVWNTYTQDFTPKHTKYTPTTGRVMLYAYLGAGVVEFDDVVIKQITPPSPGSAHKQRRHSLETKVTD